jgi:predicted regulator of Ras-like GTPase activity (Roadblock/LC7/MglB family)
VNLQFDQLRDVPGVVNVLLVTRDGVTISALSQRSADEQKRDDALAAQATTWLDELAEACGLVSAAEPRRVVLSAQRGTLVLQRAASAVMIVELARGLDPESVRLTMDGSAGRIERALRSMGRSVEGPAAIRPSRHESTQRDASAV